MNHSPEFIKSLVIFMMFVNIFSIKKFFLLNFVWNINRWIVLSAIALTVGLEISVKLILTSARRNHVKTTAHVKTLLITTTAHAYKASKVNNYAFIIFFQKLVLYAHDDKPWHGMRNLYVWYYESSKKSIRLLYDFIDYFMC